jgi:tetratricopeptide (TPR) repeat protein
MTTSRFPRRLATILALCLGLASVLACRAAPVGLPEPSSASVAEALPTPSTAAIRIPTGFAADWKPPIPGERLISGIVLTPVLAEVYALQGQGRLTAAIEKLDSARFGGSDPHLAWYAAALRTHLLNLAGRASEAELAAATVSRLELALRGKDLVARTLRGDARTRLADFSAAIQDYQSVLAALGAWRFPTRYLAPPSDIIELSIAAEARGRALTGLAFAYTMSGDQRQALPWALESERHAADVFSVAKHPLYGSFIGSLLQEAYQGRALNLAFIGTAMLAQKGKDEDAAPYFEAAIAGFSDIGFAHGVVYVEALKTLAYHRAGRSAEVDQSAQRALKLAAERGLVDFVWRIAAIQGEAQFADGRTEDAEKSLRLAQDAVDRLSGAISGDQEKRRFGVGKEDITYRLAQIGAARNSPETLFADLEKGRARAFADLLANVAIDRPASGWSELRQLDARLSNLVRQVEAGGTKAGFRAGAEIAALMAQRGRLLERIRSSSPELAEVRSVSTPELGKLRAALGADAAMLYFLPARGDDVLKLLLVTAESARVESLPVSARQFQELIATLARSIQARDPAAQARAAEGLSGALATRALAQLQTAARGPQRPGPCRALGHPGYRRARGDRADGLLAVAARRGASQGDEGGDRRRPPRIRRQADAARRRA